MNVIFAAALVFSLFTARADPAQSDLLLQERSVYLSENLQQSGHTHDQEAEEAHQHTHDQETETTSGQESHTHGQETEKTGQHEHDGSDEHHEMSRQGNGSEGIPAGFDEFPNLHPLFVHFPVVLLLLAFFSQLFSFFVYKTPLSYVTIALLIGGFVGELLAAKVYHPHVGDLSEKAAEIFETHEKYASWTLWLAGISLAAKLVSHFILKQKIVSEIIVIFLLGASAFTVSYTGHLGSQMVFIEGIGPEGAHLEQVEDHEHDHGHEH